MFDKQRFFDPIWAEEVMEMVLEIDQLARYVDESKLRPGLIVYLEGMIASLTILREKALNTMRSKLTLLKGGG